MGQKKAPSEQKFNEQKVGLHQLLVLAAFGVSSLLKRFIPKGSLLRPRAEQCEVFACLSLCLRAYLKNRLSELYFRFAG